MAEERASSSSGHWIDLSEVAHVSKLARLGLSGEELELLAAQLDVIVAAVANLSAADISEVDATAQVGELRNVTRPDTPAPGLSSEEALANASAQSAGFLRVPAIQ